MKNCYGGRKARHKTIPNPSFGELSGRPAANVLALGSPHQTARPGPSQRTKGAENEDLPIPANTCQDLQTQTKDPHPRQYQKNRQKTSHTLAYANRLRLRRTRNRRRPTQAGSSTSSSRGTQRPAQRLMKRRFGGALMCPVLWHLFDSTCTSDNTASGSTSASTAHYF